MEDKVSIEELVKARFESATAPVPQGAWKALQAKSATIQLPSSVAANSTSIGASFTSGILSGLIASAILVGGSSTIQQHVSSNQKILDIEEITANKKENSYSQNTIQQVVNQQSSKQNTTVNEHSTNQVSTSSQLTETTVEITEEENFEEAFERVKMPEAGQEQLSNSIAAEAGFESSIQANKVVGESSLSVFVEAPSGVTRAVWDAGDGSPKAEGLRYEHTYTEAGTYTVTMIAQRSSGEFYQDQLLVTVSDNSENEELEFKETAAIKIPNVFTPNSDGYNDEFIVSVDSASELQLSIYNSVGRLVHQERSQQIAWDGKELDGSDAPTGTYFYQLKIVMPDGSFELKKGSITLNR